MKNKKLIIPLVLLMIGGLVVFGMIFKKNRTVTVESLKKKPAQYDKVKGLEYVYGGGMEDSYQSQKLYQEEGKLYYRTAVSSCRHAIPVLVKVYEADNELLKKVDDYVREYNLSVWDDVPESEFQVLDAPGTSLNLIFENGRFDGWVTIDYDRQIPEDGYQILNDLMKIVGSAAQEKNLVDMFIEDSHENVIHVQKDADNTDEEIAELISGYWTAEGMSAEIYGEYGQFIGFEKEEYREYELTRIVHEHTDGLEPPWYVIFSNPESGYELKVSADPAYNLTIIDPEKGVCLLERY